MVALIFIPTASDKGLELGCFYYSGRGQSSDCGSMQKHDMLMDMTFRIMKLSRGDPLVGMMGTGNMNNNV